MLHLYLGPMYAGKTTKLIHMYNSSKDLNKVIIDFEPVEYCYEGKVKNHNNIEMNAIKTKNYTMYCPFINVKEILRCLMI